MARVTRDVKVGDRVAIPSGAKAQGEVTLVERGGKLRERARLGVRFTSIVLADEPTGNLDSRNGEAVMDLLKELHADGATICMVTHDERFAGHAERAVHLLDGRVVEDRLAA